MRQVIVFTLVFLLAAVARVQLASAADLRAVTPDGRQVLLKSDHTWEYVQIEQGDPASSAVLSVQRVWEMDEACRLQFRLQNNLPFEIRSLVPRLSVQNLDGVVYDTRSISFTSVRPTNNRVTEVQFSGIGCHQISHVKVFDAARCTMGTIDQWNEQPGECLGHIYVEPTDLINITK